MKLGIKLSNRLLSLALKELVLSVLPSGWKAYEGDDVPRDVDVLVVDYPVLSAGRVSAFRGAKVLVLDTGLSVAEKRGCFLLHGVKGVVQRDATLSLLIKALDRVHKGELWIDQETLKELVTVSRNGRMVPKGVTPRERDVLFLVCKGYTNKEIASELGISLSTVKSILGNLYRKFNVSGRSMLQATVTRGQLLSL